MSLEAIDELRNKVVSLYNRQIDSDVLGSIALEIILKRNEIELESAKNPTPAKKTEIDCKIKTLHELEITLVSLYAIQGLKSTQKIFELQQFKKPKYNLY